MARTRKEFSCPISIKIIVTISASLPFSIPVTMLCLSPLLSLRWIECAELHEGWSRCQTALILISVIGVIITNRRAIKCPPYLWHTPDPLAVFWHTLTDTYYSVTNIDFNGRNKSKLQPSCSLSVVHHHQPPFNRSAPRPESRSFFNTKAPKKLILGDRIYTDFSSFLTSGSVIEHVST